MRIRTLAGLSLAGMVVTSAAVAATTQPAGDRAEAAGTEDGWVPEQTADAAVAGAPRGEPTFVADGTLRLEGRLGHAALAAGSAETYVLVGVDAPIQAAVAAAPANVAIVIDRSRSMRGRKMANAIEAARGMIRRLREGDTVSVVAYNTRTTVVMRPTQVTRSNRSSLLASLTTIPTAGNTCISCGVEFGLDMMRPRPGALGRLLLLSDGEANSGLRRPADFSALGARARALGVAVSSIGVDLDYNERILFALSRSSNGRHYFVENPARLATVFDEELQALAGTVADQAEVELKLANGVELVEVVDRDPDIDGNLVRVPLGAFATGDSKTVFLRVRVDSQAEAIADVRLRYRTADGRTNAKQRGALVAVRADQTDELEPVVEARLASQEVARAIFDSNAAVREGDLAAARRAIKRGKAKAKKRRASVARKSSRLKPRDRGAKTTSPFDFQDSSLEAAWGNLDRTEAETKRRPAPGRSKNQRPSPKPAATRSGKRFIRDNAQQSQDLIR